jgi:hypothetical protein
MAAYVDFGDCITFDTTYKSNKYHLPLVVFVGVNKHLQSTIFGVALMGNETEESFKWTFNTFLKCMVGKQPICILTGLAPNSSFVFSTLAKITCFTLGSPGNHSKNNESASCIMFTSNN